MSPKRQYYSIAVISSAIKGDYRKTMEQKLAKILNEVGLTSIQINVYTTILKSGGIPVSYVAKALKINRTNTYNIIEKLKTLNLVFEKNTSGAKYIYAKPVQNVQKILDKKSQELDSYKNDLISLKPFIQTFLTSNSEKPSIRIYEGASGLDELEFDIIDRSDNSSEILLYTNQENEKNIFSKAKHESFVQRRVKKKIHIKVLAVNNDSGRTLQKADNKLLRETRFLPKDFAFNSEMYIYSNKICMIDMQTDVIGIIMESDEIYKMQKQIFDLLWKTAAF